MAGLIPAPWCAATAPADGREGKRSTRPLRVGLGARFRSEMVWGASGSSKGRINNGACVDQDRRAPM